MSRDFRRFDTINGELTMSGHHMLKSLVTAGVCAAVLGSWTPARSADKDNGAISSKTISYKVGDKTYKGYLAWDPSIEGKRPGVLVVHEWWGLNDYARSRADQLARLGYVAFACDMYGDGKTTTHPSEAREMATQVRQSIDEWVKRAQAGLSVLKQQEQCDSDRLAAIGYCFGGATVLQLAYSGADVDAFVTFHAALPIPSPEQAKQIKGHIQINHGAADPMVTKETLDQLAKTLKNADAPHTVNSYPGAEHSFTNPHADEAGIKGLAYDANADRKSWAAMQELFAEVFNK